VVLIAACALALFWEDATRRWGVGSVDRWGVGSVGRWGILLLV